MKHSETITCPHCDYERDVLMVTENGTSDFYKPMDGKCPDCGKWDDDPIEQGVSLFDIVKGIVIGHDKVMNVNNNSCCVKHQTC